MKQYKGPQALEDLKRGIIFEKNNYWDRRYKEGGTSGKGSIGRLKAWKWNTISRYINKPENVIDVGCGDLTMWDEMDWDLNSYIGLDISETIIKRNKQRQPDFRFICTSADVYHELQGEVVLCLDLLFHIMDDDIYEKTLKNLCQYSEKWIFIYTWYRNPFLDQRYKWWTRMTFFIKGEYSNLLASFKNKMTSDNIYQKYRDFSQYITQFEGYGFKLVAVERNEIDPYGAMYIFCQI